MADAFVQVPPDSTGKKVDTSELTVSGSTVERQRLVVADPAAAAALAAVRNVPPGGADYGVITRPVPAVAQAAPFPVMFLRGTPVFWDDFESGPGGWVAEDHQGGGWSGPLNSGNRWTWSDGNEYSCYVTSEASFMGSRSLRVGGSQTTWNGNASEQGTQDVSAYIAVPSGVIGIELMANFDTFASSGNPNILISLEAYDGTNFKEMWLEILPKAGQVAIFPANVSTTILSSSVPDSNGLLGPPQFTVATNSGGKGTGQAWHRIGFVVNHLTGQLLRAWIDKYYFNLAAQGTGTWKLTASSNAAGQEGVYRVEIHSRAGTSGVDSVVYYDNIVVTDEAGIWS